MEHSRPAVHRTIVALDVEGYGDHRRSTPHRLALREGLHRALRQELAAAHLPLFDCRLGITGDGIFALAPAHILKSPFVEVFPSALADAQRQHNDNLPL